ncbi:MAG: hypothetical protein NT090_11155, partial [Acidobacteria bacterium]|nr:hypothetical protein [Acidobacteriota bacterium]
MFVLPSEELYRHAGGPGGRHGLTRTADRAGGPADVEHDLEAAMEEEWSVLSAPLGRDAETQIMHALNQYDTAFMLVRSEGGDALGTRLARGRFGA